MNSGPCLPFGGPYEVLSLRPPLCLPLPLDHPSCSLPLDTLKVCMWRCLPNSFLQGAAEYGMEKIPEPIKEATALFYGEEGST